MKAAVVHGPDDLRLDEKPDPEPQRGEVLIKVEWGGICGSDISYVRRGASGTAVLQHPLTLGHEVAGRVIRCGEGVSSAWAGTEVTVMPATLATAPDENVPFHLNPEVRYLGSAAHSPHTDGGFTDLLIVQEEQIHPLPAGVSTQLGALTEPLAVALHAIHQAESVHGGSLPQGRVLVNGCGPIGLLILAALTHRGHQDVIAADISPASLARAHQLGAAMTINLSEDDLPRDPALSFEASGAPEALGPVLGATQRGGTVIQVGNLPSSPSPAALGNLVSREITWLGSFRFIDEMPEAIELFASGLDISPVISHTFELDEVRQAFDLALDRDTPSGKILLRMSQP